MTVTKHAFGSWPAGVAADFVGEWEGCKLHAYICPAGIWTIGYGHTGDVLPDDEITQEEADRLLQEDLAKTQKALSRYINVPVSEQQFVALLSLAFNVGVTYVATKCPKLMRALNSGDEQECARQFLDITKSNGRVLTGLVRRRKEEAALFLEGSE